MLSNLLKRTAQIRGEASKRALFLAKLDLRDRVQVVILAYESGLNHPPGRSRG